VSSRPSDIAARIDALLPQTQCTRCGFPACRLYADAITGGQADINQCPPGGTATIRALAELLQRPALPLNPANGIEAAPLVAWIDESRCIGCARCLPPCPVDAIVGAAKLMHTVLPDRCTGCELCLSPCPVDCIVMVPAPQGAVNDAAANRARYEEHQRRFQRRRLERQRQLDAKKAVVPRASNP
jgi:electron transport complex protein RnfB